MKTLFYSVVYIGIVMVFVGCHKDDTMNTFGLHVFWDVTSATENYIYIFRNKEILAQRIPVDSIGRPIYDNRQTFFWISSVPDNLENETQKWLTAKEQINPPFPPDVRYPSRNDFPKDKNESGSGVFFLKQNKDLVNWLSALRTTICIDKNKINKCPQWVLEDPRLKQQLGM